MKVSLISPIHRKDYIEEILEGYVGQDAKREDYEVFFIATNKMTCDTLEFKITETARYWQMPWKFEKLIGASNCEARNYASSKASGDLLLFVDGDQFLHPTLISEHIKKVGKNQVGIGIMNIQVSLVDGELKLRLPPFLWNRGNRYTLIGNSSPLAFTKNLVLSDAIGFAWWHNREDITDYINCITRNCSYPKDWFFKAGGFDLEMGYSETSLSRGWEDVETALRAYESKLEFVFVPSWTVHLDHPEMMKDYGYGNMIKMVKKHPWFLDKRPEWFAKNGYSIDDVKRVISYKPPEKSKEVETPKEQKGTDV